MILKHPITGIEHEIPDQAAPKWIAQGWIGAGGMPPVKEKTRRAPSKPAPHVVEEAEPIDKENNDEGGAL
ncbi:MAG: hypothetical protein FWG15_02790 [Propionibacteriaceae bacterium]|nr:hypothetical protein [Propionibacteriaceae bacterium]